MTNKETVEKFLGAYQKHDFKAMHECLADNVKFSDYAFEEIKGNEVKAMWHWFCIRYCPREDPIEVPEFEIADCGDDSVSAKYRVSYLYGDKQRPVDYVIDAHFKLLNGKIVEQHDKFGNISELEFAAKAFGLPLQLLASTPLLRMLVKRKAGEKLKRFMEAHGYL